MKKEFIYRVDDIHDNYKTGDIKKTRMNPSESFQLIRRDVN